MAEKLFEVSVGLSDSRVHYLSGSGLPSGTLADGAPIGSYFTDVDTGKSYKKKGAGAGDDKWIGLIDKDYFDTYANGVSWREPSAVTDTTLTTVEDVLEDLNADDQIQSFTIKAGDRLLLAGLTDAANVYIVSGTTGAWQLSQDGNEATDGDTLYTEFGDNAGVRYTYNGTIWVRSDKTTQDELSAIRAFIGKDGIGIETPSYSSSEVVGPTDSLETAISKLDDAVGASPSAPVARTTGAISSSNDVNQNVAALDAAVGANVASTNYVAAAGTVNQNIAALDQGIGARQENGTFTLQNNSVNQNLAALDVAVANTIVRKSKDGVTALDTVDEILVDLIDGVEWSVIAVDAANPSRKTTVKMTAVHDGTAVADAANTDSNQYSKIQLGGAISGLTFVVDLNGTGITQTMRLRIQSTSAVNVKVARIKL